MIHIKLMLSKRRGYLLHDFVHMKSKKRQNESTVSRIRIMVRLTGGRERWMGLWLVLGSIFLQALDTGHMHASPCIHSLSYAGMLLCTFLYECFTSIESSGF